MSIKALSNALTTYMPDEPLDGYRQRSTCRTRSGCGMGNGAKRLRRGLVERLVTLYVGGWHREYIGVLANIDDTSTAVLNHAVEITRSLASSLTNVTTVDHLSRTGAINESLDAAFLSNCNTAWLRWKRQHHIPRPAEFLRAALTVADDNEISPLPLCTFLLQHVSSWLDRSRKSFNAHNDGAADVTRTA